MIKILHSKLVILIQFQLQKEAEKLGKSITDIARETGMNRNTTTALYHGKVDGIRFSTLEKLCATHGFTVADLIERSVEKKQPGKKDSDRLYRQEGEITSFTCFPSMLVAGARTLPPEFLGKSFGGLFAHFRKEYGYYYWHAGDLNDMAEALYRQYTTPASLEKLFGRFRRHADILEQTYRDAYRRSFAQDADEELNVFFLQLRAIYHKFWEHSLFIDAFDAGFDTAALQRITRQYRLSVEEIAVLSAPAELTFANECQYRLLLMLKPLFRKKISQKMLHRFLLHWFAASPEFRQYQEDYDYVQTSYVRVQHITLEDTVVKAARFLQEKELFAREYVLLGSYAKRKSKSVAAVLHKHRLLQNPAFFFAQLTAWREYRKKVNLMGIHVLNMLLDSVETRTGIPKKYLLFLSFDEFPGVLNGLVTKEVLQQRYEEGILVTLREDRYTMVVGKEAESLRRDLEKRLHTTLVDATILPGQVACQGYARGIACVVMNQAGFHAFRDGAILVTGMTRPEFVPLMKRAAAIVTNEGGITSHAAIVSRELGKPCIIGTKVATDVIHNGDLIEVRAHHGTVRILKKANRSKRSSK